MSNLIPQDTLRRYQLINDNWTMEGDWTINAPLRLVDDTEPPLMVTNSNPTIRNRLLAQFKDSAGNTVLELGSCDSVQAYGEVRFADPAHTKIGFPTSDPSYFAFINDTTEFWLGNTGDDTLYFNYYVGSAEYHGRTANLLDVNYFVSAFSMTGDLTARSISFIPNSANGQPFELSFGSGTTGLWIDDNKKFFFGTGKDAAIYYDSNDLVIDPQEVGSGGLRILSMKSGATQAAAGATADELWKTSGHASLPDNVVMIGV